MEGIHLQRKQLIYILTDNSKKKKKSRFKSLCAVYAISTLVALILALGIRKWLRFMNGGGTKASKVVSQESKLVCTT